MNVHQVNKIFLPLFLVLGRVVDTEDRAGGTGDDKLFLHIDLIPCEAVSFSDGILGDIVDDA